MKRYSSSGVKKSKLEAGYEHLTKPMPERCGNCKAFLPEHDCAKVDKNSPGPDQGKIEETGWCKLWKPRE